MLNRCKRLNRFYTLKHTSSIAKYFSAIRIGEKVDKLESSLKINHFTTPQKINFFFVTNYILYHVHTVFITNNNHLILILKKIIFEFKVPLNNLTDMNMSKHLRARCTLSEFRCEFSV